MGNKFNITLDVAKDQLVVDHSEDDSLIGRHLEAAVEVVLDRINMGGITGTTRTFNMSSQASRLGHPVSAVVIKKRVCVDGSCAFSELVPEEDYELLNIDDMTQCLSFTEAGFENLEGALVQVRYTIGLAVIPKALIQAALMMLTHFYENRSEVVVGQGIGAVNIPSGVDNILGPYRSLFFV